MGLVLSVDVGTTNIKAALVDENGQLAGEAKSINMKLESDATGRAEHDPLKLHSALLDVCRQAIGTSGQDIECVSLTSYHFGLVLTDANHQPLTRISTFVDTTAQVHHARFLEAVGDVDGMYVRTGCPPIFQYPVTRMHYIATYHPEIRRRTAHVLDSKSFIMHFLTGEYATDYSTANATSCFGINGKWDEKTIAAAGFDKDMFPRVVDGFADKLELKESICSELGLKKGTKISAGLFDGAALAAGLTGFAPKIAVGNFGTSAMFRVPTDAPIEDLKGGLIQSCLLKPGLFFTGAGINNCTIATNLLLSLLGQDLSYLKEKELSVPGANGVMTFPYFTGERDKHIGNIGTGVIMGLGVTSTRDDLSRSFFEGVAYSLLLIKQGLDPENRIKEYRMGGGGASNLRWMQIMADVLNLPMYLAPNSEMGIIGAASVARYGEGADLQENSRRLMQGAKRIEPNAANAEFYKEAAQRYFAVRASLREPLLARRGASAATRAA